MFDILHVMKFDTIRMIVHVTLLNLFQIFIVNNAYGHNALDCKIPKFDFDK